MGVLSDLSGMVNVQRIKNGGTARLSVCQITSLVVNMSDAKQFLPENDFHNVYELFKRLRKIKKKRRMNIYKYYDVASKIILLFNARAPFILYSGNTPEDAEKLLASVEEKYADLSLTDIENEIFARKPRRKNRLSFAFWILTAVLLCSTVFLCYQYFDAKNECEVLQQSLTESENSYRFLDKQYTAVKKKKDALLEENETLEKENDSLIQFLVELDPEVMFWRNYAVIVTSTGDKYHTYGCSHINEQMFWIYNIDAAKSKGYFPCLDCDPPQ